MSRRNHIAKDKVSTIPRRSPRFLPTNSPEPFHPNTPKLNLAANRNLHSPLSSTSKPNHPSKPEVSVSINRGKSKRAECRVGKKVDACNVVSSKNVVDSTLGKSHLRVKDCNLKRNGSLNGVKAEFGVVSCEEVEGMIGKRVTRSESRRGDGKSNCNAKHQGDMGPGLASNRGRGEFPDEETQGEGFQREEKEKYVLRGKEQTGRKRKLNQCRSKSDCAKGWTEEQEQALQRAYFAEKPTPQFWKRVAKMVGGKSAQDCFDKIHSAHLTPPQTQRRSRAKKIIPSPLSFSASKLLNSPEPKSKRLRCSRLAQKTLRQLVQKQCIDGKDEGADLFAIFEATADPSTGTSKQPTPCSTPTENKSGSSFLNRCHETSSADRKSLSRLNMSSGSSLLSPPVLKQVKNKALHEKYIDQLHRRETKRKAALSRKQVADQNNKLGTQDGKTDALNAARSALYFDASDAINQFQQSQMNAMYNCDLPEDDHLESGDDREE